MDESGINRVFETLLLTDHKEGYFRQRIDNNSQIPLYAACLMPDKKIMLEFGPVKENWMPREFNKPQIKGLICEIDSVVHNARREYSLKLTLTNNRAKDVFYVFAEKIREGIDGLSKPSNAISGILDTIETWKDFFANPSKILSDSQQLGLLGELYLIKLLIENNVEPGRVLPAWIGNLASPQDFEFYNTLLETKSTASQNPITLKISNLEQLNGKVNNQLFIVHLQFEMSRDEGISLPLLIEQLRHIFRDVSRDLSLDFDRKLSIAGYFEQDTELYKDIFYILRKTQVFEVRESFPRLILDNIPEGIVKASYEILLSACIPYKYDLNDLVSFLEV